MPSPMTWLLSAAERGNDATALDRRHPDGAAYTAGNSVRPLIHGGTYFARLQEELRDTGPGDRVYFADWRGDGDQQLTGPGTALAVELSRAASAGARVHGLIWRSHLDRFRFSEHENRGLAEAICAVGGDVVLDQRVRRNGSHHQKLVVIRRPAAPQRDVAFVGGIDLGHGRRDDARHLGDPQRQPMAPVYGPRPPWHDAQLEVHGPAVADLEECFVERWNDPTSLDYLRPWTYAVDRIRGMTVRPNRLPGPLPAPPGCGDHVVQVLRTYPPKRPGYPFAPDGERSVARAYAKAVAQAERLVYVEDQFLWSAEVAAVFAGALRRAPQLQFVAVVPRYPDDDRGQSLLAMDHTHREALQALYEAGGPRVTVLDLENHAGTPVYVHAKVCIVDDVWAAVGSANLNLRSWTHDSELTVSVVDGDSDGPAPEKTFARSLRLELWREHLDREEDGDGTDLLDPAAAVGALRAAAERLDEWHQTGRTGSRPPGRLRRHATPAEPPRARLLAPPLLRAVYDPDGRRPADRRARRW